MNYKIVKPETFEIYLKCVDQKDIRKNRSYQNKTCYIAEDCNSGFALTSCGVLCHVFSTKKGHGKIAVKTAIKLGANRLSCYNDKLESYYKAFGFHTSVREPWEMGSRFWMCLKQNAQRGGASCANLYS